MLLCRAALRDTIGRLSIIPPAVVRRRTAGSGRMSTPARIVIVGAGQAGLQTAVSLRQGGYEGALTLVGEEPAPPYQRPPLSKGYLKGDLDAERLWLKPAEFYGEAQIELVTGEAAAALDTRDRVLELTGGRRLGWDRLVLATGARPRKLDAPGVELAGVLELRTLADVDRLRPALGPGRRLVVVGAGYIGLEAAAAAAQLGAKVTVLEAAAQALGRVAGPEIGDFYCRTHRAAGVDIRLNARLASFEGRDHVTGVRLHGGEVIACDVVLIGIGVVPNLELAREAGVLCGNGVVVNADGRTSHPDIFAAGDVAFRPLAHYGREGRLESVHNAIEGGKIVAAAILGQPAPAADVPWFWSDQFDLKLQTAGLWTGAEERIVRGDPASRSFAVFYLKSGRLLAVDAVNAAPEYMVGKKLIASGAPLASAELGDTSIPMKEIGARALKGG
jgi:3-phenylpropionate/trans-cinnamate dioxygenase ferredoxin reductase component